MERPHGRENVVSDTAERYIYQVSHRLPGRNRKDIEAELRGLIEDMLETRCGASAPGKEDIDAVLTELGAPSAFAAQYGAADGRPRYLIGPALFPQYVSILRIVLLAVTIGIVVASILQSFLEPAARSGFELVGLWAGNIFSALCSAAAGVTLLFAILEWRGVKLAGLDADWLAELPPVPAAESRFSRGECIFGIVISSLFLLLLVAAPQYIAAYTGEAVIPLFDMELYPKLLPLIAAACVLGIVKEIAKLLEGRYTMRLAVGITVMDVLSIALCVIVLSRPIWNRSLILMLQDTVDFSDVAFWKDFWNAFGQVLLGVVLFGHAADIVSLWYHTLRAVREA